MFNYLKLFSFFTVLCNFLLLLPDQVFFNDFLNTSINPDFASKYSFIKLKSGSPSLSFRTAKKGGNPTVVFACGLKDQRPRSGLGSSLAVARALSDSGIPGHTRPFSRASSDATQLPPCDSKPVSAGSPRNYSVKTSRDSNPRSQHTGSGPANQGIPSRYGPGSPPLKTPPGCIPLGCPNNPEATHYYRPGSKRKNCPYCD
ncbi:Uncharacterized protein CTYZ_00001753 [Cryptosporidium tyzzeri]|nr:Uncharacterized protein CTYZ_00001753 [Cryptosporidium tyzzeri]